MNVSAKNHAAWKVALLIPAIVLAGFHIAYPARIFMDDIGYWHITLQWREYFRSHSLLMAIGDIHAWPNGRPSFFSLLSMPFLWISKNSIFAAGLEMGILFSLVASASLYGIFREKKASRLDAVLGALAITLIPHYLAMGRFYMVDFPLAALCFAAIYFLVRGKYTAFSLIYAFALLIRPIEGGVAAMCFLLFLWAHGKKEAIRYQRFFLAAGCAFLAVTLALFRRVELFVPWMTRSTVSSMKPGTGYLPRMHENPAVFIPGYLYSLLGLTGLLLLLHAFVLTWKNASERKPFWALLGLAFIPICMLFSATFFDNGLTREYAWRYVSLFLLMFCLAAILATITAQKQRLGRAFVALFLATNAATYLSHATGLKILEPSFLTRPLAYERRFLETNNETSGVPEMVSRLASFLPAGKKLVLFAGRSNQVRDLATHIEIFCGFSQSSHCPQTLVPEYLNGSLRLQIEAGQVEPEKFKVDAIVLARDVPGQPRGINAYPSEEFVTAAEKFLHRAKGFTLAGTMDLPLAGVNHKLDVYVASRGALK